MDWPGYICGDCTDKCTPGAKNLFEGMSPDEAVKKVGMVVEGINALPAALELEKKYGVEMPLVDAVEAVVHHGADPKETVRNLMTRPPKSEQDYIRS